MSSCPSAPPRWTSDKHATNFSKFQTISGSHCSHQLLLHVSAPSAELFIVPVKHIHGPAPTTALVEVANSITIGKNCQRLKGAKREDRTTTGVGGACPAHSLGDDGNVLFHLGTKALCPLNVLFWRLNPRKSRSDLFQVHT